MKRILTFGSFTRFGTTFYPTVWLAFFLAGLIVGFLR